MMIYFVFGDENVLESLKKGKKVPSRGGHSTKDSLYFIQGQMEDYFGTLARCVAFYFFL